MTFEIRLGGWCQTFAVVETDAPRRYDWDFCVPVCGPDSPERGESRVVLIPLDRLAHQTQRYRSGLFRYQDADTPGAPWANALNQTIIDRITDRLNPKD